MPIMIPNGLPAAKTLADENIFVMNETRAVTQDIRPLQILVLNLMPTKIATETQLSRLLGNTPLQVELELIHTDSHESKNTSREHLLKFYQTFEDVRDRWFDGLIITGAPVEQMPFEQVEYWPELCRIMEWSRTHVHSTFHICWGAQAGLYYHYGIGKVDLPEKLFGVYPHRVERRSSMLMRGFDDVFMVPHSRHTSVRREDIERCGKLKILASPRPSRPGFTPWRPRAAGRSSSPVTRNTTRGRWSRNICAIKTPDFPSMCRRIITRTTTTRSRPWSHGAVTQTSCTRTGSTTSSTRPHRTTSRPSGLYKHQKSGKGSPLEQRGGAFAPVCCFVTPG